MLLTSGGGSNEGHLDVCELGSGSGAANYALLFMFRRKWHGSFSTIFLLHHFSDCEVGILFVVYRYSRTTTSTHTGRADAISVLLGVAVMDEILQHLLKQYGGNQKLASVIFRWACGLLILLSIVNAFSTQQAGADRVVSAVLAFDRSERVMQCGLCIL
jgi:hypothetical protein